jgi:DNA-binding FrmR family transcriptional regulator
MHDSAPDTAHGSTDQAVHGYTADKDAYLKRLRRVEGQVRGLQRLIQEDTYCIDVLTQISATTRALQAVALALMDDHLRHCVAQAAVGDPADAEQKLTEASAVIRRLVTS